MLDFFTRPTLTIANNSPFCGHNYTFRDDLFWGNVLGQIALNGRQARQQQLQQQQLQLQLQQQQRQQERNISVKHVETNEVHQIQLFKRNGDFSTYEIRLIQNKHNEYILKISSQTENYIRAFELNADSVDLDRIDWEWYRDLNALVIDIPLKQNAPANYKKKTRQEHKLKKSRRSKPTDRANKHKHEKSKSKRSRRSEEKIKRHLDDLSELNQKPAKKTLSSGSDYYSHTDSELETPSETDTVSENDPDVSDSSTSSKVVARHAPSMEDVEDEEFVLLRKRFAE